MTYRLVEHEYKLGAQNRDARSITRSEFDSNTDTKSEVYRLLDAVERAGYSQFEFADFFAVLAFPLGKPVWMIRDKLEELNLLEGVLISRKVSLWDSFLKLFRRLWCGR